MSRNIALTLIALPAVLSLSLVAAAFAVWRQRRVLARLDDEMLRDIGLTAREADREARRPIWDVPLHWRA